MEEDESATLLDPQTREFIERKLRDNASSNQSHSTAGGVKTLQKLVSDEAEERIIAVDLDKLTTVNSLAKTAQENMQSEEVSLIDTGRDEGKTAIVS